MSPEELAGSASPGPGTFMGPVRRVAVNGVELGFRQFGNGRDLVVITGDACTMTLWGTEFPRKLASRFRVTLFDNRGAGYSTDDVSSAMTIELLAADAAGLIGALGLRRPDVLGWSMGGEIGLTMAVRHPDAVRRLVTTGADSGGRNAVPASKAVAETFATATPTPDQLVEVMFPPAAAVTRRRFIEEMRSIPQQTVTADTARRQDEAERSYASYEGTWTGLKDAKAPMLVTNGAEDVVAPAANADVIVSRVGPARARKAIFDGAGHGMWFQEMDRFVSLVADFLGSNRP